ncbi:MAG: phosphatase PAP2 family protein [Bacteroidota bacterium]
MKTTKSIKRKRLGIPICLAFLGTVCFAVMAWWYQTNSVVKLDETVIGWMAVIRRDWLTWVFRGITLLGSLTFIVTADLVITTAGLKKKYNGRDLLIFNLANISGVIMMQILKMIFGRERPPRPWLGMADGFSFPSGHSLMAALFYGFLLLVVVRSGKVWPWRKWLIAALGCLPILVGFSRVYLGVHYASDVLAGWAAGIAWVGLWMGVRQLGMRQEARGMS